MTTVEKAKILAECPTQLSCAVCELWPNCHQAHVEVAKAYLELHYTNLKGGHLVEDDETLD